MAPRAAEGTAARGVASGLEPELPLPGADMCSMVASLARSSVLAASRRERVAASSTFWRSEAAAAPSHWEQTDGAKAGDQHESKMLGCEKERERERVKLNTRAERVARDPNLTDILVRGKKLLFPRGRPKETRFTHGRRSEGEGGRVLVAANLSPF